MLSSFAGTEAQLGHDSIQRCQAAHHLGARYVHVVYLKEQFLLAVKAEEKFKKKLFVFPLNHLSL